MVCRWLLWDVQVIMGCRGLLWDVEVIMGCRGYYGMERLLWYVDGYIKEVCKNTGPGRNQGTWSS